MSTTSEVFISYAHSDAPFLDRLSVHLRAALRRTEFTVWDDRKLRAGDKWRDKINNALANAQVIVVILSVDFLASEFIMEFEYPPALKAANDRGARIIVLVAGPCFYDDFEIADFHFINDPKTETLQHFSSDDSAFKQEEIYVRCVREIKEHLTNLKGNTFSMT